MGGRYGSLGSWTGVLSVYFGVTNLLINRTGAWICKSMSFPLKLHYYYHATGIDLNRLKVISEYYRCIRLKLLHIQRNDLECADRLLIQDERRSRYTHDRPNWNHILLGHVPRATDDSYSPAPSTQRTKSYVTPRFQSIGLGKLWPMSEDDQSWPASRSDIWMLAPLNTYEGLARSGRARSHGRNGWLDSPSYTIPTTEHYSCPSARLAKMTPNPHSLSTIYSYSLSGSSQC